MAIADALPGVVWRSAGDGSAVARDTVTAKRHEGRRWPKDFTRRDEGRLWVRRDFVAVFEKLGWRTFDDVMTSPQPALIRRIDHRSNHRAELPSPTGGASVRVYLKRHVGESARRRLIDAKGQPARVTSGLHEADAVGACQQASVPTMDVVAVGQQPSLRAGRFDSFFISEHLPDVEPADQYWPAHLAPSADGAIGRGLAQRRAGMLAAMARTAARLHAEGLFHRDLYWCHFMVGEPADSPPAVHLIDLQRLYRPRFSSTYARMKDLAQFLVAAPPPPVGPTHLELEAWYAQYMDVARLGRRQRISFAAVGARAGLYRLKGLRA